jgi:aspartate kinase
MALIVQKYGGTSVGTPERIENVAEKVIGWRERGHQDGGRGVGHERRNRPVDRSGQGHYPPPHPRELDVLLATGRTGHHCAPVHRPGKTRLSGPFLHRQPGPHLTDNAFNKARIQAIEAAAMQADLDAGRIVVVAGFQGVDEDGNITTLGRGGSDTTGVALAAALKADECQIYTDVDGVYTTDPRVVPEARRLDRITFEEMLEMASAGLQGACKSARWNSPANTMSHYESFPPSRKVRAR